jgi:hypothetical protein
MAAADGEAAAAAYRKVVEDHPEEARASEARVRLAELTAEPLAGAAAEASGPAPTAAGATAPGAGAAPTGAADVTGAAAASAGRDGAAPEESAPGR